MATTYSLRGLVSATALIVASLAGPALSQSFDEVLAGAKTEGKLFVLVSSPGKPETHVALGQAFNARFGLNTSIEWTATSPVQTGTKLIAEQSGAGFVDVIGAGGNQEMSVLAERGILKPYPWMETFGKELKNLAAAVDPVIDDLKGSGLAISHNIYGIAWNKDLIADEDVPNTYAELLAPEWSGRFAVNAFSLNPVDYYSFVDGEEATLKMAKAILDNKPVLERGTGAVTRAITVGQAPVGISSFHQAGRVPNLGFKVFADHVALGILHIYVPENAPNPNTARLFAAWMASEGMAIVNQHEPMPRLGDGSPADKLMADAQAAGATLIQETSLAETNAATALRAKIAEMMTQ